jgi:hypothetical protein
VTQGAAVSLGPPKRWRRRLTADDWEIARPCSASWSADSNIDIDIPAIAFHSLVLAILSNSCRRNVTDPEHERPFGKAMLPGGTEALCLCPESLRGWPHRLKICSEHRRHQRIRGFPEFCTFGCAFAAP